MATVDFGIVGSGSIAHRHARSCRATPGTDVIAAANWRPESLARLAQAWSIPRTYTDFAELAADPEVDAAIICLPNSLHAAETVRMLRAGKHVLVEKPMAMNAAEAETMLRAAEESGRLLMVAHNWRFDIQVQWLRRVVAEGLLGQVVSTKSFWNYSFPEEAVGWFADPAMAGGGIIMDMAVHALDTTRFLLGEPRPVSVYARTATRYSRIEVEDNANLFVTWDDGVNTFVETSARPTSREMREEQGAVQVYGTRGYARLFPDEAVVELGGVPGVFQPRFPPREERCDWRMYQRQIEYFAECIRGGSAPVPGGREGLVVMRLVDAAYHSARTSQVVALEPVMD